MPLTAGKRLTKPSTRMKTSKAQSISIYIFFSGPLPIYRQDAGEAGSAHLRSHAALSKGSLTDRRGLKGFYYVGCVNPACDSRNIPRTSLFWAFLCKSAQTNRTVVGVNAAGAILKLSKFSPPHCTR